MAIPHLKFYCQHTTINWLLTHHQFFEGGNYSMNPIQLRNWKWLAWIPSAYTLEVLEFSKFPQCLHPFRLSKQEYQVLHQLHCLSSFHIFLKCPIHLWKKALFWTQWNRCWCMLQVKIIILSFTCYHNYSLH